MASTLKKRLELHDVLLNICENCYFEPPTNKKLKYPCIVYNRTNNVKYDADNIPYILNTRYTITVIDPDPDSEIVPKLEMMEKCTYDTHFETEGLSHDVFTIYY